MSDLAEDQPDDPSRPAIRVAAAVVVVNGIVGGARILITQRPPGGALPLEWEFPGGKIEPGETPEVAVVREVREELGVTVTPIRRLQMVIHDYVDGPLVKIWFIHCKPDSFTFTKSNAVHAVRWPQLKELDADEMVEADRAFVRRLQAFHASQD